MARKARSRKKSSTQKKSTKKSPSIFLFRDILAVIATAAASFFVFSLISLPPIAQQFCKIFTILPCGYTENLMGPAGQTVGQSLFGLFGFASVGIACFLIYFSILLWQHSEEDDTKKTSGLLIRVTFFLLSLSLLSGLLSLIYQPIAGGMIGGILRNATEPFFGVFGASLLHLFSLAVAVKLTVERPLTKIASDLFTPFFSGISFVVTALAKGSYFIATKLSESISAIVSAIFSCISVVTAGVWFVCKKISSAIYLASAVLLNFVREKKEESRKNEAIKREREVPSKKEAINLVREETPIRDEEIVVVKHPDIPLPKPSRAQTPSQDKVPQNNDDRFKDYEPPPYDILSTGTKNSAQLGEDELLELSKTIEQKLLDFNVKGKVTHVHPGPVITMFEFVPAAGVKVGKIVSLQDDLAMALRARAVRIVAPLPDRGTVGIEVPNEKQEVVTLGDLLGSKELEKSSSTLTVPLGKDIFGRPVIADIASMPHVLLAGATGTGKSVCINALLISLLYNAHPDELQLILIDPKILELSVYEAIPHLKVPVVSDPKKAKAVLQWAVHEMDRRYRLLKDYGVRSIDAFNNVVSGKEKINPKRANSLKDAEEGVKSIVAESLDPLPKIVIVIDELADLMLSSGRDVEELITRLAQKARAAGIHMILATQRPSVDVITGLIKANFPARISFRVSSRIDSRTILDAIGAERLLGRGDMLFLQPGRHSLTRVHGAYVTDREVREVTKFLREVCKPDYDHEIMEMCEKALDDAGASLEPGEDDSADPLYDKALQFVLERGQASTSMIQRAFRIGYNRAARIVDMMEREGIVGPMDGSRPRPVIHSQASNEE